MTDTERLEIAVGLLGKRELDIYAEVCRKRELGCPDGYCDLCQQIECPYMD